MDSFEWHNWSLTALAFAGAFGIVCVGIALIFFSIAAVIA